MFKKISAIAIISSLILTISACNNSKPNSSDNSKIKVVVTFNAMMEFTKAIGRDKVTIQTIIPEGTEPHNYEPKVKDLEAIGRADMFVFNGFGMEKWVNKSLKAVNNKKLIIVDASKGFPPITNTDPKLIKDDGQNDPHIWISIKGAKKQALNIQDALIKVDPKNKAYYEANYSDFNNRLEQLFNEYNSKFNTVNNKNFVTGHAAFAYLCRDFGLNQNSVEDVFADGEPGPQKLTELVKYCKEHKIRTIFVEDILSPKVSETLANEVGAKTEKIYTFESRVKSKDYLQCMQYNLEVIYNSLAENPL